MFKAPILFLVFLVLFSFISKDKFVSDKFSAPPGTVQVSDSLYIDKCEVSNLAWREFIYYTLSEKKDAAGYQKMLPDTNVWKTQLFNNSEYVNFYFRLPDYQDYPVVGISYEQAQAFCEWRTERVNELLERMPKAGFRKLLYRLPTKAEWELAASGKLAVDKYPYGYENTEFRSRGKIYNTFNCLYERVDSNGHQTSNVIPVLSSEPNKYEIYNMIGNVSELIAEKGIAKGGNYLTYIEDCKINNFQKYDHPTCWLGFRCLCEIIDKTPVIEKKGKKNH